MKIIIVHASAGAGHYTAAKAIYNYLKEHRPGDKAQIVDVLEKSNLFFRFSYRYGYSFLIKFAPFLWGLGFWVTYWRPLRLFTRAIASFLNRLNTAGFADFLINENPDCVISTHFLPSEVSAQLKTAGKIKSKIVTVITDFGVHPFWVSSGTDVYTVASELTKEQLIGEGAGENTIRVTGIPVDSKFLNVFNKDELLVKFNLHSNGFRVLVVTGSFGTGPVREIAAALCGQAQIMVVCANNKKLFADLSRKNYPGVRVFGFINNIEELMAISDMIITKPGGLSISESLAMELFPVFIAAIPGQEEENMRVLAKCGLGIKAASVGTVKEAVVDFQMHPEKLSGARKKARELKKPFAARDICDAVC
ncbi:MAG: glycosyltransferase [Candidatus Omnitrophica bacterium]|nr:glycosyltransferase [Candidatus Omnitrophota bacterium]